MNQNIFVSLEEKISSEKDSVNNEKSSKKKGSDWIDLNCLIDQKVQIESQPCSSMTA